MTIFYFSSIYYLFKLFCVVLFFQNSDKIQLQAWQVTMQIRFNRVVAMQQGTLGIRLIIYLLTYQQGFWTKNSSVIATTISRKNGKINFIYSNFPLHLDDAYSLTYLICIDTGEIHFDRISIRLSSKG